MKRGHVEHVAALSFFRLTMEHKTIPLAVKTIDGRVVTGYQSVTGNIDSGGDRIIAGAFSKTILEQAGRVRYLWMHDPYEPPIAKILSMREVSAAELPGALRERFPDATGALEVRREYLTHERATAVFEAIAAGAITESSIGYDAIKFDNETVSGMERGQVRNLREVRLWDVSDVNWGMNPATMNLKAMDERARLDEIERMLRGGNLSDEAKARLLAVMKDAAASATAEPSAAKGQALTALRLRQSQQAIRLTI